MNKAPPPPPFKVSKKKDVVNIEVPMTKNSHWEQWVLCQSDQHYDSTHCDRVLLKRDLELALQRNAIILSGGDQFDIMQGRRDPRSSKSEMRPEYKKSDYFSAVLDDAVDFWSRYAKNYAIMIHGNHETACIKNNEVDMTKQLVTRLNERTGSQIWKGEYEEFVRLSFIPPKGTKECDSKKSKLFYMNHGFGGASPITGGVIDNARIAEYVKADFVLMGHVHTKMVDQRIWWEVTNHDTVVEKRQNFIRTASYKKARMPGETTWETVKGIKPKPRGGTWIRFYWDCVDGGGKLLCEIIQSA